MRARLGILSVAALALAALAVFASRGCAVRRGGGDALAAVRAVIREQEAAWNRGDLEGYMNGYERSDQTSFVSGDKLTRGWQTVLERYRAAYDTREKMGALAFTELEVKPLSEHYALATGRWRLERAGDQPRGRFTLLFRRTPAGWRIVHDHTSSVAG